MAGLTLVTVPGWWNERRYGMLLHANIATVASFAPVGARADAYWSHLGGVGGATPMAEVLAHHRDRWAHVDHYDDFIPFLSFHRFDADEHLDLALAAGMRYLVHLAKHRDGWCWWDAPGTDRSATLQGPRRDVTAEVAAACRRAGVLFGTSYSVDDWSDARCPSPAFIDEVVSPQVLDLVGRYSSQIMWTEAGSRSVLGPAATDLIERARALAAEGGTSIAVNDGWGSPADFATLRIAPPAEIRRDPWELCRGLGASSGYNRAELAEHLLSTGAVLDLLTEVIAKGGNLLLDIGLAVDGTISELQQRPLRQVGAWVADHDDVINASRPFDQWGDAQVRYVVVDDAVVAIDLAAGSDVVLAGITPDRYEVSAVEADDGGTLHWEQHRGGITISRIDRSPAGLAGVYRLALRPAAEAIRLFDESSEPAIALQPLLDAARAGDIVQLRDARYEGPIDVPDGVTVRGLGWDRTRIEALAVGPEVVSVRLGAGARIEHIDIAAGHVLVAGAGAAIAGCRCRAPIDVRADDAAVLSVIGPGATATRVDRLSIERCAFKGDGTSTGIAIDGGVGHRIVRNEVVDHACDISLIDAGTSLVAENRLEARHGAIDLARCDDIEVVDNTVHRSMRAVHVE
ncbi:MAG TPA: alpha-L-fucosidase, partial [Ilumatobacteraceae bacterium]